MSIEQWNPSPAEDYRPAVAGHTAARVTGLAALLTDPTPAEPVPLAPDALQRLYAVFFLADRTCRGAGLPGELADAVAAVWRDLGVGRG